MVRLKIIRLAFLVSIVMTLPSCLSFLGAFDDSYLMNVKLKEGVDSYFDFEVKRGCTYEIGLVFRDDLGGVESIKQAFGEKLSKLSLPAEFNIKVLSIDSNVIFSRSDFGGRNLGFRYGPNPVIFVAGKVYIPAGNYKLNFFVNSIDEDLSSFESHVIVRYVPKTTCK